MGALDTPISQVCDDSHSITLDRQTENHLTSTARAVNYHDSRDDDENIVIDPRLLALDANMNTPSAMLTVSPEQGVARARETRFNMEASMNYFGSRNEAPYSAPTRPHDISDYST